MTLITKQSTTFKELEDKFNEKLSLVQACGEIKGGWGPDTKEELLHYSSELRNIAEEIDLHKVALQNARLQIHAVKCVLNQIEFLSGKLCYMKSHLPQHLPCLMESSSQTNINHNSQKEAAKGKQNGNNIANQNALKGQLTKQPNIVPKVQYITTNDFASVPQYTKGRIQYDQVNRTIDQLNLAIETKYCLMKKNRSKLTPMEMSFIADFKKQVNKDCKGLHFVVESDIKRFTSLRLDPACRNILTILRTLKKIKEVRGPGNLLRYCVVTNWEVRG